MEGTCPFCNGEKSPLLMNSLAFAIYDKYPVTQGHTLIIPKRHYSDFFESNEEEIAAIVSLLWETKGLLDAKYRPDGYNVGINSGIPAGQTILHFHIHLIPRYKEDMEEPRGGVRGVIPAKQKYPQSYS